MASQISRICNGVLTRMLAFGSRGVTLKFPAHSRSGVRPEDGMVIFAMVADHVRMDDWGCSCLLWTPDPCASMENAREIDGASDLERLGHCRLAMRQGMAEGFLLYGDAAPARCEDAIALRVIKAGQEYWAKWGSAARAELPRCEAFAMSAQAS